MDKKLRDNLLNDLKGALDMVGQAQGRVDRSQEQYLWKQLGDLFDNIDSTMEYITDEYEV